MDSKGRVTVVTVVLVLILTAAVVAVVIALSVLKERDTECSCNGFGVNTSLHNEICNQETGISNCNTTLNVGGDHCDVCETGFVNRDGQPNPESDGCPLAVRGAVIFDATSNPQPLLVNASLDPRGQRLMATISGIGNFTLDVSVGAVSSDDISVSVSYYNVSGNGLPGNVAALGLLDMSAVSNDPTSEYELFGRTFEESIKVEVDPGKTFEDDVVYPYLYDSRTKSLEANGLAAGVTNSTALKFFTTSLSPIVFLSVDRETLSNWMTSGSIDTGFTPQQNGWPSLGHFLWPMYNGMTIFARWFYVYKQESLQSACQKWSVETLDRMLTLLQVRCSDPPPQPESLSDIETFESLVHALFVSHAPQLVWMEKSDESGVLPGHSVLVYMYDKNKFTFYDPQFGEQTLLFDSSTQKFEFYSNGGCNRFRVYSHRAFRLSDTDMETIYNETFTAFNDSNSPDIVMDQFDNNITTNSITVRGRIVPKSGQPLPAVLFSYVFSNDSEERAVSRGRAHVDSSGRFRKVLVDIASGSSKIVFVAGGYVPRNNSKTRRAIYASFWPPLASLYDRHGFIQHRVYRSGNSNLLTVALTWDDGASDIDLHVLEPNGRHIYYNNLGGEGTPFLDHDNVKGFGPEHYIVDSDFRAASGNTLEGTYKIRVHYRADKGEIKGRSIRWLLKMQGTTQDGTTQISGVLQNDNSKVDSNFLSFDSSWSPTYEVTIKAVHFIAIADRGVIFPESLFYHYSAQLWRNVLVLPKKQTEEKVSILQKNNPMARKEAGVELLREPSLKGCSYKGWRLRKRVIGDGECWKTANVAISRIHYSERSTRYIPIFTNTDWSIVEAKWNDILRHARMYSYAEQPESIVKYPQSIYCFGDDVNNSNTFIRWLFDSTSLPYKEMRGAHPGRYSPLPVPTRSFQGTAFCSQGSSAPSLTRGTKCGILDNILPLLACID